MTNIVVPELGESVVEARVARWLKKEGDRVEIGEPIVELETEKIDLEAAKRRGVIVARLDPSSYRPTSPSRTQVGGSWRRRAVRSAREPDQVRRA